MAYILLDQRGIITPLGVAERHDNHVRAFFRDGRDHVSPEERSRPRETRLQQASDRPDLRRKFNCHDSEVNQSNHTNHRCSHQRQGSSSLPGVVSIGHLGYQDKDTNPCHERPKDGGTD